MKRLFFCIMMLCATQANAEITGNDMLKWCSSAVKKAEKVEMTTDEHSEALSCMFYLNGFISALQVTTVVYKPRKAIACISSEGTMDQIARLVVKSLKDSPENLHNQPGPSVALALAKAFPCK